MFSIFNGQPGIMYTLSLYSTDLNDMFAHNILVLFFLYFFLFSVVLRKKTTLNIMCERNYHLNQ